MRKTLLGKAETYFPKLFLLDWKGFIHEWMIHQSREMLEKQRDALWGTTRWLNSGIVLFLRRRKYFLSNQIIFRDSLF